MNSVAVQSQEASKGLHKMCAAQLGNYIKIVMRAHRLHNQSYVNVNVFESVISSKTQTIF